MVHTLLLGKLHDLHHNCFLNTKSTTTMQSIPSFQEWYWLMKQLFFYQSTLKILKFQNSDKSIVTLICLLFSGMFRRITAAATRLFTGDGSDGSFYTLESLSDLVQSMIPTHPSLVLLWCQILLLVNYTNYNWWSEVHQTPK